MSIDGLLQSPIIQAVGWALLHLLWQGTLVALLLAAVLSTLRRQAAAIRYVVACGALVLVAALPVLTAWNIYKSEFRDGDVVSNQLSAGPHTGSFPLPEFSAAAVQTGTEAASPLFSLNLLIGFLQQYLPLFLTFWAAGVLFTSSRLVVAWLKLRRLAVQGVKASPEWQHALARLTHKIRLSRPIHLLESAMVEVPTVIGWVRPVILLPVSALTGLSRQQLETILAHELAHVRRHDFVVNLFQSVVETLFFYHPAVWWISSRIRVEREHCCDDLAVELCGSPVLYARALADLEQTRFPAPALALSGGSLLQRVRRLITESPRRCSAQWLAGVSILTMITSLAIAAPLTLLAMYDQEPVQAVPPAPSVQPAPRVDAAPTPVTESVTVTAPVAIEDCEDIEDCDELDAIQVSMDPDLAPIALSVDMDGEDLNLLSAKIAAASPAMTRVLTAFPAISPELAHELRSASYAFTMLQTPQVPASPAVPPTPRPARAPRPVTALGDDFDFDFDLDFDVDYDFDFEYDFEYEDAFGKEKAPKAPKPPKPPRVKAENSEDEKPLNRATLTVDQLIKLKTLGITPEYIQEMERAGFKNLTLRDVARLRHSGVTASDLAEFGKVGLTNLSAADLARLKMSGVNPDYVRSVRAAYPEATVKDIIGMRHAGVTADFVSEARSLAGGTVTIRDVIRMRHYGVDRRFIEDLGRHGYRGVAVEELLRWKSMGITTEYIEEMKAAGLTNLTTNEIIGLRHAGVTGEFVKSLRDAGLTGLSAREIIRLRHAGVDAEFIRQIKKGK